MKLDLQNGFSTMLGLNSSAAILTTEGGSHDLNNEGGLFWVLASISSQQLAHRVSMLMFWSQEDPCWALHGLKSCKALRSLWALLVRLCQRMLYIRVEVSRYVSTVLFEAIRAKQTFIFKYHPKWLQTWNRDDQRICWNCQNLMKSPCASNFAALFRFSYSPSFSREALTDFLAKEAEMQGLTCSWDQEALQEQLN